MKYYVGIDPGQTGAAAFIFPDETKLLDWSGDERRTAAALVWEDVLHGPPEMVFIEHQQSFGIEGRATLSTLMQNYGMWLGMLAALNWPVTVVRPSEWKKGLGYPKKNPKNPKPGKDHSLTLARRLFPGAAGGLTRVKDHNRAEALLLAYLARGG